MCIKVHYNNFNTFTVLKCSNFSVFDPKFSIFFNVWKSKNYKRLNGITVSTRPNLTPE